MNQDCLCSLGLVPSTECPAHPIKEKRPRPEKPSVHAIRAAECAACAALGTKEHDEYGRHKLGGYNDVAKALKVGSVYAVVPKLGQERVVVHDVSKSNGAMELYILEGWSTGPFGCVWMEPGRPSVTA